MLPGKPLSLAQALLGLGLGGYTGILLAATAVPLWATAGLLLGPLFLATAVASGAAALALLAGLRLGRSSHTDADEEDEEEARADVETLRSYLKFPPHGTRAIAPGYGSSGYVQPPDWSAWMAEQDEETCVVVHIETRRAYENAEEIISTPGVDMVYVGPGDFSIEMGHPGNYDHPDVAGPMQEIPVSCMVRSMRAPLPVRLRR